MAGEGLVQDPDGWIIVDNTILGTVATCSTKAAMEAIIGMRPAGAIGMLLAGNAIHDGLAVYLATRGDAAAAMAAVGESRDREDGPGYRSWAMKELPTGDRLQWSRVSAIFQRWMAEHPIGRLPIVVEPDHIEVAATATMEIAVGRQKVIGVRFVALVDALAKKRTGGGWFVCDHKTTGRVGEWWANRQKDSSQYTGAMWALSQEGPEGFAHEIVGVVVNGIELPKPHTSEKVCPKHKKPYIKCSVMHAESQWLWLERPQVELRQWRQSMEVLTKKLLRLDGVGLEDLPDVPMEGRFNDGCVNCDLREWCRRGRKVDEAERTMRQYRWNPLERVGWKRRRARKRGDGDGDGGGRRAAGGSDAGDRRSSAAKGEPDEPSRVRRISRTSRVL